MDHPSITVNRNTTLSQLQDFTKDLKDTKRLRGKLNEDGSVTLYAKSSNQGLWSKIFGHSDRSKAKSELARKAVETVLSNTKRSMSHPEWLTNVRKALDKTTAGELKILGLKLLTSASEIAVRRDKGVVGGPGLDGMSTVRKQQLVTDTAEEIQRLVGGLEPGQPLNEQDVQQLFAPGGDGHALVEHLGDNLSNLFQQKIISEKTRENLVLSDGSGLKDDLRKELEPILREQLGHDHPALQNTSFLDALLEGAFLHATKGLLPNSQKEDGTITVGGDVYKLQKHLGDGAHATVDLYVCEETGKQLALKVPLENDPETMQSTAREIRAHRAVTGQDNVVGLLGPVRMTNGVVGIAVEFAPHGDLYGAMSKINERVKGGRLSPETGRAMQLTLLKDMARGLGHMHSVKGGEGVLHLDFGARNMFIGDDGVGKIGDFGLSLKARKFDLEFTETAKNAYMLSPETTKTLKDNRNFRAPLVSTNSEEYQQTREQINQQFEGLNETNMNDLCGSVRKNIAHGQTPDSKFDAKKSEVWSLGVIGFEMMTGRLPVPEVEGQNVTTETEKRYLKFGGDFNNRAFNSTSEGGEIVEGSFGESTGNEEVDDLLNQLLHPDPRQRPDMDTLLNHQAFKLPGVGSDDTRRQLVELIQGEGQQV